MPLTFNSQNSAIAAGLDFSGTAWNQGVPVTAITPRHVITARHFGSGNLLTTPREFRASDGTVHTRQIIAELEGDYDLRVLLLDSPLPETVKIYKIPTTLQTPESLLGGKLLATDQLERIYSRLINEWMPDEHQFRHINDVRVAHPEEKDGFVSGDSGHPLFFIGEELILAACHLGAYVCHYYGDPPVQSEILDLCAQLDASHSPETVALPTS